jgi:membrane protease YdiL (CAAX protease family)
MKKILFTIVKILLFFVGWAVLAGLIPVPELSNAAVWRFLAELIPFLVIVIFTLVFWLLEKKRIKLHIYSSLIKNIIIGIITGIIWIGTATGILMLLGTMKITAYKPVPMLWLWMISVFINAAMQELLVRGYLYQLLKTDFNIIVATAVTTAIFTFLHGGAFEAGLIPVLNVLTMSLFMTTVLEYTQSLLAPSIIHFVWNFVGAIILGGVQLADDYPHLCITEFTGNIILSGGEPKIEGRIITLILNILLIIVFALLIRKKNAKTKLTNTPTENI